MEGATLKQTPTKSKNYWYVFIAISAMLLQITTYLNTTALAYYYNGICAELGFDRSALAVYYSLLGMVGVFSGFVVMKFIYPKIGARKLVTIFGTIAGVAYLCFSFCTKLWQFYALAVIIGFCGMPLVGCANVTISRWFLDKNGLVLGISSAMTGIAGVVLATPLAKMIETSWHSGYVFSGILYIVICLLVGIVFIRTEPADVGMKPYGLEKYMASQSARAGQKATVRGMKTSDAIKTPSFWLFVIGTLLFGFYLAFVQSSVYFFAELGFDMVTAAGFLAVLSASLIVWKLILGWLADKLGGVMTYVIALAISALSFVIQIISGASNTVVPYIFIFLYGCGVSSISVLNVKVGMDIFGPVDQKGIQPLLGIPAGLSNSICVVLWGMLYTATGSYIPATWVSAASAVVFIVCLLLAWRLSKTESFQRKMVEEVV